MPKPTDLPRWNTDLTNQTEPTEGKKDAGWAVGDEADSSIFNWLFFTIYQWCLYLDGLYAEAIDWTGAHTFSAGIQVINPGGGTASAAVQAVGSNANGARAIYGLAGSGTGGHAGYFDAALTPFGIGVIAVGNTIGISGDGAIGVQGQGTVFEGVRGTSEDGAGVAGSSDNWHGGSFEGGVGNDAHGVYAKSNGAAGGHGVRGEGSNDPTSYGGSFDGVAGGLSATARAGSNGVGLYAKGDGTGLAAIFEPNTPGGDAVVARGRISFDQINTGGGATARKNTLGRRNFSKAVALITCNGSAAPTIHERDNVATVVQSTGGGTDGQITVTLAQGMAHAANYGVEIKLTGVIDTNIVHLGDLKTSATEFVVGAQDAAGNQRTAAQLNGRMFLITVYGEQ